MSCNYGYLCRTCGDDIAYGNNVERELKAMFIVEREANALLDAVEHVRDWDVYFESRRYGQASIKQCFTFLKLHRGHDLVIGNEYNHEIEYFVLTHPKENDGNTRLHT